MISFIMADVIVKKSKIEGFGVFASRDFKKDEVILKWKYKKLTKEEVKSLPDKEKRYVTYIGGEYIYLQEPERYLNHSCDANTYPKNFSDVARRDIKKGEEITTDYGEQAEPNFKMVCHCGSKKCRGVIKSIS